MKKIFALLISCCFLTGISTVFAADIKFGVIDIQKITQNFPKVTQLDQKLKEQFTPDQQKLVAQQKQIESDITKFNRDSSVMKEADKKATQEKIAQQQKDFQQKQLDFQKKIYVAQNDARQAILKDIQTASATVAKEMNLNLILVKDAAFYSDESLDVTDQVLKKIKQ